MKKFSFFLVFFLLFSCSEDDGEKTYKYFPNNDQNFKLYDYEESLILDVKYTNYDSDFSTPDEYNNMLQKGDKIYEINLIEDGVNYQMFYVYCKQGTDGYKVDLIIDKEFFGYSILYNTDKPINSIKDLKIYSYQNENISVVLTFGVNKGLTGIYVDGYRFERGTL